MNFKYSVGDVINNLEILGLDGKSNAGVRLYKVRCLLCGSVKQKRLQAIQRAKSCGCMKNFRDAKVAGSGRRTADGTRLEINTIISIYKSNAKKRDIEFSISYVDFEEIVDSPCYFCGDKGVNILRKRGYSEYRYTGIDRVDNDLGYIKSNCVPCCAWCNRAKNSGTLYNFIDKCKKISKRIEMDEVYLDIARTRITDALTDE